jgi:TonB-dependent starch-binding outer membrane protein SusC
MRIIIGKPKILLILLTIITFSSLLQSQSMQVNGRVTDSNNLPIAFATILNQNSKDGSITDDKGNFDLTANAGDTLFISFLGYDDVKTVAAPKLNIILYASSFNLDEVVVVGYGSARKRDLTGSLVSVGSKDFQKGVITSPDQLIAGKLPGVSIISNGGRPGSGSEILIRGGSSLSASNSPLIVLDGVPLSNDNIAGAGNPFSFINPDDIESFTVLKDASAAAIYGTRASNGVILITTKKSQSKKLKINFSTTNSVGHIIDRTEILTADQFRDLVNSKGSESQKAMLGDFNTDWQDLIFRNAFGTNNNLSLSGSVGKLPYRVSLGYQNQNGILKTDNFEQKSVAINLNPVLLDGNLKVDLSLKGNLQNTRFGNAGAIGAAISFNPTVPVLSGNDQFGGYWEWLDPSTVTGLVNLAGRNPLGLLEQREDRSNPSRAVGNLQLDYKMPFAKDLRAVLNLGYDMSRGRGTTFESQFAANSYLLGESGGFNNQYRRDTDNSILEFSLNYNKEFSESIRMDALAGYAFNNYKTKNYSFASFNAKGEQYPNTDPVFPFDIPENTLISTFGRVNMAVKNRYLLTATIRRDGSSRFAPQNRWGTFPSLALAWNMKEETFLKNVKAFDVLKLRAGYGITGQQDGIGNYDYLSYYALSGPSATYQFGDAFVQGFRPAGFYANRKWEETATTNIAIDFGFLGGRVSGSIDYYIKETSDLLNNIPQPAGANFSAFIVANVGSMENKGVELNLNLIPVKTQNFTWEANINATYNVNKITNLTIVPDDPNYKGFPSGVIAGGIGGQFVYLNAVGSSRNTFNLYQQVYGEDGRPVEGVYVDQNLDGIINQDDLIKSKSAIPDWFFGLTNNFMYKKWYVSTVMRASLNNYVYNNIYSQSGVLNQFLGNSVLYNGSANYFETGFRGGNQQLLSDYYIQNGSFIKLDNVSVSYDLGSLVKGIDNVRIGAAVQNVMRITKYKGIDPEISSGIDNNIYPRPRTYSITLNIQL